QAKMLPSICGMKLLISSKCKENSLSYLSSPRFLSIWQNNGKAMMWTLIKLKSLSSLDEMVAPLRADDDENWLESVPVDPWGNPYVLEISTEGLRVRSFGADGRKDTADDIMNRTR
ncbi:MAG: type II secretion system protein GspG, partial [Planctomycetota bacterium]